MAEKTPVRVNYDGSNNPIGFAEFQADDFIGLDDGGTGGSYASLAELLSGIGLGTADTPTFTGLTTSGNVTIGGNLTVDGTTTTVNSTTVTIDDPIFTLGGDAELSADDNKDRGIEFRWHDGTGSKLGFFGFDDSTGKFTFIPDATNAAETFSGTVGTIVANLEGNVTGTVSSLSGLDTDDLAEGSTNLYYTDEKVDDRVAALLIDSATSGIDISYDDAAGELTISADLSEITTDLNERVDDRVDSLLTAGTNVTLTYDDAAGTLTIDATDTNTQLSNEEVQDIVGGMVDGGTETNVTVTYDDTAGKLNFVVDQLTSEQVQDIIGPMFSSNTETFITVTYDDSDGTLDLVVPVLDEDNMSSDSATHLATQQSIKAYVDSQIQTEESIEDFVGGMVTGNTETLITVTYDDSDGTMDFVVDNDLANYDNSNSGFITATLTQEEVEDFVGGMVSGNTETLIGVTYDDTNGKLDFVVDNDLSNYDNTTSGFITATLTQEQVEDYVGGMLDGTETLISVSYDDTDGNIDFVVEDDLSQYDNTTSAFITLTSLSGGTGVTYDNSTGAISIGQAVSTSSDVTFNDVTVSGDLTVSGTTTTVNSTTVTIDDPIVRYADNNTGNSVDIGFYGKYVQSSTTKYAGLVWDASQSDKFRLFHGNQSEPTTTVDITGTGHTTGTLIANVEGDLTGDVTGNADTATALASGQNFSLTGDVTATAVSFDGTGAVALSTSVTESAVTQHEAALTITESQISDLQSYLTAETNDLSSAVTWANVPDANITQSSVTQHQSALSITESQISDLGSYITASSTNTLTNKTINFENNTVIVEYAVTVSGGNFLIDGEANATISFNPGIVYRFDLSDSSTASHPFKLSTTEDGSHNSGTEYTTGKTSNGTQGSTGAYVEYTVNAATSDILYYYCSSHSGMGGTITVFGSSYGDADVQAYISAGTGISISGSGVISSTITQYADSDVQAYLSAGAGISINGSGQISSTITQYADSDVQSYLSAGAGIAISGTGQISSTITQYANSDVESYLSGGTGVTFSSGVISIGQAVSTTSDVTFNDVTVSGDLTVSGTTTTINTETLTVDDNIIVLNNNVTGTPTENSGIEIERGTATNKTLIWNETDDKWTVGSETFVAGTFEGALTGNVTGNVTGDVTGDLTGNVTGNVTGTVSDVSNHDTDDISEGSTNQYFTNARADARIAAANLEDLANVGFSAPGASEDDKVVTWDNTAGSFALASVSGLSGSGETNTASNIGTAGVGIFDGKVGEDLQFKKLNAGSSKITITDDTSNNEVDIDLGTVSIEDLSDVTLTSLATNELLAYNGTAWVNIDSPTLGGLTLESTDAGSAAGPSINLYRNSASPANADYIGEIDFQGESSTGVVRSYAQLKAKIADPTNSTEDGTLEVWIRNNGSNNVTARFNENGMLLTDGMDLKFEGATNDSFETTLTVADPTADRTVTLPDATGTVILTSSSIGDLSDVDITTSAPTNGQALVWNASNSEFEPGTVASSTNYFQTIAVSGQSDIVPDSTTDTLNFAAGANITLTTDASTDTVTIAATGGAANAFSTLAVAGQSNVVADAETDTLTLTAGTGMTITTDASTDTITFASSGGSAGSMPVTLSGGTSDPINLSSISTIGAIPFTDYQGNTDNIDLTGTSQTVTTFADNDGDTKIEVERTTDDDTVYIKAGGTDAVTVTSAGVTINNLTVTGTSTQANEMKITDTLIELNADGTSLGVDAGLVIERGNTGADAAFIWDESSDSFAVGTLSTDGAILFTKADGTSQPLPISSSEVSFNHANGTADNLPITSSSLAFTEADGTSDPIAQVSYGPDVDMSVKITEATLKAKTQTTGDNSTAVATTAFVQASLGGVESDTIKDADNDTKIEVEASSDADEIVITTGGQERAKVDNNISMSARGGFFTHNLAMHASETFTIASTEGTVAAGPLDIQGTVDVQGSLVVL